LYILYADIYIYIYACHEIHARSRVHISITTSTSYTIKEVDNLYDDIRIIYIDDVRIS